MPVSPLIGVFLLSVLFLCFTAVNALAPCNQTIIDNLPDCYEEYIPGRPPSQMSPGKRGLVQTTTRKLFPLHTKCIQFYQRNGKAYVSTVMKDPKEDFQTQQTVIYDLEDMGDYLLETDPKGNKTRMYVIFNRKEVYSYYRCVESGSIGDGVPEAEIVVGCGFEMYYTVDELKKKSRACFNYLGIQKRFALKPCTCSHEVW